MPVQIRNGRVVYLRVFPHYYSAGNSKVKYNHSATSTAVNWWLRSPNASYSNVFVYVYTDGTVNYYDAYCSLGFAPGFCV